MVLADKDKIKKELLEKKEVLELRLKTIEKQEKTLTEKAAILQKEVMEVLKNDAGKSK